MKQKDITEALLLFHRNVARELKKEKVLKKVVDTICTLVKCDGCAVFTLENGHLSVSAYRGFSRSFKKSAVGLFSKQIRYTIRTGKGMLISDIKKSTPDSSISADSRIKSLISVPVELNGRISAIIVLGSRNANAFKKQDLNLVKLISSELSSIMERSHLYARVEQLSIKDQLTGCFNRRNLVYDLNKKIEECKRYKKVFSVIMMDFDNFKKYNDRFGHSRGDTLLKSVCAGLRKILRKADVMYRYGGDEFVVLLPETNKEGARVCSQRLEKNIEEMDRRIDEKTKITLSTGIAGYPEDASTALSLIKIADRQMYKNKFLKKSHLPSHS